MSRTNLPVLMFLFCFMVFSGQKAAAQEKWGKVSKEVLAMKVFPEDSTAPAVVLFDVAKISITQQFTMNMERHVRIKILSEEGKDAANVKIRYFHKDNLGRIEAQTILPNGKKIKLSGKQIFEESVKNYYKQKVFAIPGIEVGSVIEYRYKLSSEYLQTLEPWYFQNEYYTKLSKVSVSILPGFHYNAFQRNIFGAEAVPTEEDFIIPSATAKRGKTFTWELENLPGISKEPYMLTLDDYRMALFFQLIEYRDMYSSYRFIKTWDDLAEKLNVGYKEYYEANGDLRKKITEIMGDTQAIPEKIKELYEFSRDEIETDWIATIYPRNKPGEVLEKRKGTPTEKNFLLLSMLRDAGIEAKPMLISTRRNGTLIENWPQLGQFDRVIVYAEYGSQKYFMDAADRYCPFCVLPQNDIVSKGLVIDESRGKIVDIPPPDNNNMTEIQGVMNLDSEGNLRGKYTMHLEGYRDIAMREKLNTTDMEKYISELLTDQFSDAKLDTFEIAHLDSLNLPLGITLNFSVPEFAQIVNDNIYFSLPFLNSQHKNPFGRAKRFFPVDFNYIFRNSENIELTIPEEFEIAELPAQKTLNIKSANYALQLATGENGLIIRRSFNLDKTIFYPSEYGFLRSFYGEMVSADQGQVVLRRIPDAAGN